MGHGWWEKLLLLWGTPTTPPSLLLSSQPNLELLYTAVTNVLSKLHLLVTSARSVDVPGKECSDDLAQCVGTAGR